MLGQATDGNMAQVRFVLDNSTDTHSECVVFFFWIPTTTVVARTRLNITLYVCCVSFVSSWAQLHTAGVRVQRSLGRSVDRRNTTGDGVSLSEDSAIIRVQIAAAEHARGVRR